MKKIICVFIAASVLMIWACERTPDELFQENGVSFVKTSLGEIIPGQYVVLLKDGVTSVKSAKLSYPDAQVLMRSEMQKVLAASEISEKEPLQVYTAATEGFAVKLSDEEAMALGKNPGVLGVWPDKIIVLAKPVKPPTPLPDQVTPPGIDRVGGGATYAGINKVWIIDTGIDLTHPDLNVDVTSGITYVPKTTTPNDDHGHGTNCAGIIAAINNSRGVVGVAAGAKVVPVKVLDKHGSGAWSTIIKGVDFVTANGKPGDAVNMSIGGSAYEPIDIKVEGMGGAGLFVAVAAGNGSDDAINYSPARAEGPNIYTVSACDKNDIWASFSNYGSPVDFCAPGVDIFTLSRGGGTTSAVSGTSFAAPHMCGVLLVTGGIPRSDGTVIGDPDGVNDPIVHE